MGTKKQKGIIWLSSVEKHDYAAAESYLSLLYPDPQARALMDKLRSARVRPFKAKDIFRASRLPLLGVGNSHVDKDRAKIRRGEGLSPLLLVRDRANAKMEIADGYHRLCAIYLFDEDATIECKIV
jgi:hypothetical protein